MCFIVYRGANTLRSRWYLVQVSLEDNSSPSELHTYHVEFFRCHPDDMHKPHNIARWCPVWYEIAWVDKVKKTSFDYGHAVLVRPNRKPDTNKFCRFGDTVSLSSPDILLAGPFDFAPKIHGVRAH